MPSKARITLLGHVGRDAEQRYSSQGQGIVSFSVPVNVGRKQPDGTFSDATDWYRVTCFGRLAERAADIKKGDIVQIDGSLRLDRWTGQDGTERVSLDVMANDLTIITRKNADQRPTSGGPQTLSQDEASSPDLESLPF